MEISPSTFNPADYKILVVDDESFLVEGICFELEAQGYKFMTANSGHKAWEICQENEFDLILTDVRMPNGDGVELLDRVRGRNGTFPFVMFSTGYKDITTEEAYAKGVNAIVAKPFLITELLDKIREVLMQKK